MADAGTRGILSEIQFISKIINSGSESLIVDSGITPAYFNTYAEEYKYICDHYRQYHSIPDSVTFIAKFDKFELVSVNESNKFLVDSLIKTNQERALAEKFNRIRKCLMEGELDKALDIDKEEINVSLKNYLNNVPNILSYDEGQDRYNEFIDKMSNFNDYYISTGFTELDENLGGGWDRKEELATFVARPGVGKSWMLDVTAVAASNKGMRVGLYSGEMSKNKVGYRIDTIKSHISNFAVSHGRRDVQNDYKRYVDEFKNSQQGPIFLATIKDDFDGNTPTIRDFESFIKKYKLDILLVDQQSLMEDIGHSKQPIEKAGNIAKELKLLQTTMKIPIITVCQQNRSGEDNKRDKDGNKLEVEYDVSRIAGSDKVGQYSTIVIFIEYDKNTKTLKLVPAKTRDGSSNQICYAWDIDKGVFSHIAIDFGTEESESECEDLRSSIDGDGDVIF